MPRATSPRSRRRLRWRSRLPTARRPPARRRADGCGERRPRAENGTGSPCRRRAPAPVPRASVPRARGHRDSVPRRCDLRLRAWGRTVAVGGSALRPPTHPGAPRLRARRTLHDVVREAAATVVSVNVGLPRTVEWHGRLVRTGIWKAPVDARVRVEGVNLVGDGQADRRVHGGPDKAVYAYAVEDYEWWSGELGREL